jgi:hypothetical protein
LHAALDVQRFRKAVKTIVAVPKSVVTADQKKKA